MNSIKVKFHFSEWEIIPQKKSGKSFNRDTKEYKNFYNFSFLFFTILAK